MSFDQACCSKLCEGFESTLSSERFLVSESLTIAFSMEDETASARKVSGALYGNTSFQCWSSDVTMLLFCVFVHVA